MCGGACSATRAYECRHWATQALFPERLACHEIENELQIERDDQDGHRPCSEREPARRHQPTHFRAVGCEAYERHDRERELETQYHLRQDQKMSRACLSIQRSH